MPSSSPTARRRSASRFGRSTATSATATSSSSETTLTTPPPAPSGRSTRSTSKLLGRQLGRELEQCQWVAVRGRDQPLNDGGRDICRYALCEESSCVSRVEQRGPKLCDIGCFERSRRVVPGSEEDRDRLGVESPCHEHEHVHRRLIEPLGIVDQVQQRLFFGGFREQGESADLPSPASPRTTSAPLLAARAAPNRRRIVAVSAPRPTSIARS